MYIYNKYVPMNHNAMEFHFSTISDQNHISSASSSSSSLHRLNRKKEKTGSTKRSCSLRSTSTRLSTDPQSVAARERRHRISERFKILQSMVPGGAKMDTVSMLDEAIQYVKFLKAQIWLHQNMMLFLNETASFDTGGAQELPPSSTGLVSLYAEYAPLLDTYSQAAPPDYTSWFDQETSMQRRGLS